MGSLIALALYIFFVVALVLLIHIVTHFLGEKHSDPGTIIPYESGVLPTGTARIKFPSDFYLVSLFFVIFDVAVVFFFAWAVSVKEVSWFGFDTLLLFVIETIVALVFIIKSGVFDWGKIRKEQHLRDHGYIK